MAPVRQARPMHLGRFLAKLSPCVAFCVIAAPLAAQAPADPLWRLAAAGRIVAEPCAGVFRAYATFDDRRLYAIRYDGSVAWRAELGARPDGPAYEGPDGTVYVSSGGGIFRAFDPSGRQRWTFVLGEAPTLPPVAGRDGRVFVTAGMRIVCLSTRGARLWERGLDAGPARGISASGSGGVALSLPGAEVLYLDAFGREEGRIRLDAPVAALSAAFPPVPVSRSGAGLDAAGAGRSLVLSRGGKEPRILSLPSNALSMAMGPEFLMVLCEGGILVGFGPSGDIFYTTEIPFEAGLALMVRGDRAYASGFRSCITLSSRGEALIRITIKDAKTRAVPAPGGLVLAGGEDWILYAYELERREAPRPSFALPGRYGIFEPLAEDRLGILSDQETRKSVFAEVEKSARSGTIGSGEPFYSAYLVAIALSKASPYAPSYGEGVRASPFERAEALRLIGLMASLEARTPLLLVFAADPDPSVRAMAVRVLGALGYDEGGEALLAFRRWAERPVAPPDEEMALSVIAAIASIARYDPTRDLSEGLRALLAIARKPFPDSIQSRALAVLDELRGLDRK